MMRMLMVSAIVAGSLFATGCPQRLVVLPASKTKMIIPAGTPFKATMKKGTPLQDMIHDEDLWVVESGYLFELEMDANRRAMRGEDDGE